MFQIVNFRQASSTNNHNSRNLKKPDLQNYLSNESNLVTGGSFWKKKWNIPEIKRHLEYEYFDLGKVI